MKKLVFATNNENKLREAREIFKGVFEILSQNDVGSDCDPEENGVTFAENALIKAKAVFDTVHMPVIADDSGLCVDALDGRPGVFSARYAPNDEKCTKILGEMQGVPEEKRTAYFECSIVYIDENVTKTVSGRCMGKIGFEERGTNGFGYDPIFMYGDKTLAEMTAEEKNAVSHRGKALENLYTTLKKENLI